MALQTAVQLAQREQLVVGDEAKLGKRGVEHRRGMALREDEVIALRVLRVILGVIHHAAEVERRNDIRGRKRPTRVTATGLFKHLDDVFAHVVRTRLDLFHRLLDHGCALS